MARTEGFLTQGIHWFRLYTDEPAVNAKYSDSDIITMLQASYAYVLGEVNRAIPMGKNAIVPIQTHVDIEMGDSDDEGWYALPPYMGKIIRVLHLDSELDIQGILWSEGTYSPHGKGYRIDENMLWVDEGFIQEDDYIRIEYVPTGCAALHEATASAVAVAGTTVTLDTTPTLGEFDTHPNAYAGSRIRILTAGTNNYMQERTIASFAEATAVATLDVALSPISAGAVTYEICPVTSQVMNRVIWLHAALDVLAVEVDAKRYQLIQTRLRDAMRELRLHYGQRDLQQGGKVERSRTLAR